MLGKVPVHTQAELSSAKGKEDQPVIRSLSSTMNDPIELNTKDVQPVVFPMQLQPPTPLQNVNSSELSDAAEKPPQEEEKELRENTDELPLIDKQTAIKLESEDREREKPRKEEEDLCVDKSGKEPASQVHPPLIVGDPFIVVEL